MGMDQRITMKKLTCEVLLALLLGLSTPKLWGATFGIENDLALPPEAYIMRDVQNGQWRAGYHKRLVSALLNGANLFEVGYVQTWNVGPMQPAYGVDINKEISLSSFFSGAQDMLSLPNVNPPKWIQYVGNITGVGMNVAYIPAKPAGMKPLIWGFGFTVNLTDVFTVLANGL